MYWNCLRETSASARSCYVESKRESERSEREGRAGPVRLQKSNVQSKPYSRMRFWSVPCGINTSFYTSKTPITYDQRQYIMHNMCDVLWVACVTIYHRCFQTRCHFATFCVHLTHPIRLHRIFEFTPKRCISSSSVMIFDPHADDIWMQAIYIARITSHFDDSGTC